MPDANTYQFYEAYVVNVQDFLSAEKEIRRTINRALKTGKLYTMTVHTKIYALLYSTFSEANFMKLVLTPHGFEQAFVDQIISEQSIQEKWHKCLELAFIKFTQAAKGSEIPNKLQNLKRIISEYIIDPSLIRNKIAHGQFTIALNSKNTALNWNLTNQIQAMDYIWIYRLFEINKKLTQIIEDLIESPHRAHYEQYYTKYQQLVEFIGESASWTIATKMNTASMKKPAVFGRKKGRPK